MANIPQKTVERRLESAESREVNLPNYLSNMEAK